MIKTTVADNGFEGILLEGNGSKDKVMIVMSGSNGGIKLTKQAAEFYHKNGIPALALALFATKGTQPYLDKVPIEKIKAPILILSSKNDSVWPSYKSGIYIENRLKEAGFQYEYKHVAYENMSHALITKLPFIYKMAFKAERANAKACKIDRENMKKELLDWVKRVWE